MGRLGVSLLRANAPRGTQKVADEQKKMVGKANAECNLSKSLKSTGKP